MKCKKVMAAALVAVLTIGSTMSSMAAAWEKVGTSDWKYLKDDGQYAASTWVPHTDGHWYYLNPDTLMAKGWVLDPTDNHWYFTDSTGALVSGLIEVNNNVYYMNESHDGTFGALFVGRKVVNGVTYNFTDYGTTNGKPYTSRKYKSDGTVIETAVSTVTYSGGSGISSTPSDPVKDKMNAVENGMATVTDNKAVVDVDVSTPDASHKSTVVVKLASGAVKGNLSDVRDAAKDAANVVLNQADDGSRVVISVPGLDVTKGMTVEEAQAKLADQKFLEAWITKDKFDQNKTATVEVVMNNQTVTYTIKLEEVASN